MRAIPWKPVGTRRFWEPVTRSLFLMLTGAYLLASYLSLTSNGGEDFRRLFTIVDLAWWASLVAWSIAIPRRKQSSMREPSPAWSGTGVVIATGVAAALFLRRDVSGLLAVVLPPAVLLVTAITAFVVYRFASKHGADIGEARFPTVRTADE